MDNLFYDAIGFWFVLSRDSSSEPARMPTIETLLQMATQFKQAKSLLQEQLTAQTK